MKNSIKTILATSFFCFFAQSYAQSDIYKAELYEMKAKKQKKTAIILAATGAATVGTGLLIAQIPSSGPGLFTKTERAGYGIATVGGIAIITSIPFAILSATNKHRYNKLQPSVSTVNMTNGESAIVSGISYNF